MSKPSQNNTDDKGSAKMKGAKEHARTPAEDVTGRPSATSPIAKKDGKSSKGTITGSLTTNEKGGGGATVERSPTSRTSTLQRTASSISSSGSTSETSPTQQEGGRMCLFGIFSRKQTILLIRESFHTPSRHPTASQHGTYSIVFDCKTRRIPVPAIGRPA